MNKDIATGKGNNREEKILINKKKIAIQGINGSFHEIAARQYFKNQDIEIIPCNSFKELFLSMQNSIADSAVMAIENTVAGGLLPNYALLQQSAYRITGETFIRIKQNLLALPGQSIEDINEVSSHYMAIAQTRNFFNNYPDIKLTESEDTALSARSIAENGEINKATIASELAAELFGLEILAEGIETHKNNYTRFLIIEKENKENTEIDKASLCFSIPHEKGSLSKVLSILTYYNINLTKIQSLPLVGKEWQYQFYIDLVFDSYDMYKQSISAIKPLIRDLRILGEYAKAIEIK